MLIYIPVLGWLLYSSVEPSHIAGLSGLFQPSTLTFCILFNLTKPYPILGAANAMPMSPITGTFDCTNPWLHGKSKALLQLSRMEGWCLKDLSCLDTFQKIAVSIFTHNPGLSHEVLARLRYVIQCTPLKRVWLDESHYSHELWVLFLHCLEQSQLQIIRECVRSGHHLLYQTTPSYVTSYLSGSGVHGPSEEWNPRSHSLGSHSVFRRSSRTHGTRALPDLMQLIGPHGLFLLLVSSQTARGLLLSHTPG